jgi:two-component system, OmpR family, phosphate regulon sensor histidine kinase PhoR
MKYRINQPMALFMASILAVVGLVVFQLSWMFHTHKLTEELFNERVCMAMCSAIEKHEGGTASVQTCHTTASGEQVLPAGTLEDPAFNQILRTSLDEYNVNLPYHLRSPQDKSSNSPDTYSCKVPLANTTNASNLAYVRLDFPGKSLFMMKNMQATVLATFLILLFTILVLLYANWALLKQKKLLETNVDFFNNMAHEFRTPLANMRLALNLLTKKNQDLNANPLVGTLRSENERLLNEVERVLYLANPKEGDFALKKEHIQILPLLNSVVQDLSMKIEAHQAKVEIEAMPPELNFEGDRQHLYNVFRNLIENALKYNKSAQPNIKLAAQATDKGIMISVQDNGIGIPAHQKSAIFERFQRAHQGDQYEKGFGLGLAYVKCIVKLHQGFVRVNSEVDKGSRFELYLPA